MAIYTTVQGDMFDNIAKAQLGSESNLDQLVAANPQYSDVVIFGAGVRLSIPEVNDDAPPDESMPPWRDEE